MPHPTFERIYIPEEWQRPTLTAGVIKVLPRVYKSNLLNQKLEEVTGRVGPGSSVDSDLDRQIRHTCKLVVDSPDVFIPWSIVRVDLEVFPEARAPYTYQVGLFRIGQPKSTGKLRWSRTEVSGEDLTRYLKSMAFSAPFTRDTSHNAGEVLTELIGLFSEDLESRSRIPYTFATLNKERSWGVGNTLWEAMTSITTQLGWYVPDADVDGAIITRPYRDIAREAASHRYTVGYNATLIGDISRERSDSSFFNHVVMTAGALETNNFISAQAVHDDPTSKTSTTHPEGPGTISKVMTVNDITDPAVLLERAKQEVRQASVSASATIRIVPDQTLTVYDIVQLNVPDEYSHLADLAGKWVPQQISHGFSGGDTVTTVKMRRNEYGG